MNTNFPYTYLRKISSDEYQLSVLIQPSSKKTYLVNEDGLGDANETERLLLLTENTGADTLFDREFKVEEVNAGGEIVVCQIAFQNETDLNTCQLFFEDYQDTNSLPLDKRYYPHLYLQRKAADQTFQLFGAIRHAEDFSYNVTWDSGDTPLNRRLRVQEINKSGNAGVFALDSGVYNGVYPNGTIEVIVYGTDNREKAKGKVRHSVADPKPFDNL